MENIEQLSDFLKNCCRVCLSVENEMVESSNIVENFNKSIDELLYECAKVRVCFYYTTNNDKIRFKHTKFQYR